MPVDACIPGYYPATATVVMNAGFTGFYKSHSQPEDFRLS